MPRSAASLAAALLTITACSASSPAPRPSPTPAPKPIATTAATSAAPPSAPAHAACAIAADLPPLPLPRLDLRAPSPSRDNLRAWVELLSDPTLRGRSAGSRENKRVASLLADALAAFGWSRPRQGGDHCISFDRMGVQDQNVIAHLKRAESNDAPVLLVGAHYDAQGADAEGQVYPGADDNASGVAALLEIARLAALVRAGQGRDKDLVLVAFGAEERGVLGAETYVEDPTVPLGHISLMINLDMVGRPLLDGSALRLLLSEPDAAIGYIAGERGKERTEEILRAAAGETNRRVIGIPERVLTRFGFSSDSVPFSRHVPTLFLSTSIHDDYHRPTDTPDKIDVEQIERTVRLVLAILDKA